MALASSTAFQSFLVVFHVDHSLFTIGLIWFEACQFLVCFKIFFVGPFIPVGSWGHKGVEVDIQAVETWSWQGDMINGSLWSIRAWISQILVLLPSSFKPSWNGISKFYHCLMAHLALDHEGGTLTGFFLVPIESKDSSTLNFLYLSQCQFEILWRKGCQNYCNRNL